MSVESVHLTSAIRKEIAFLCQLDLGEDLSCPITTDWFGDPRTTPCGHTYEYSSITEALTHRKTCPIDQGPLKKKDLVPNLFAKEISYLAQEMLAQKLMVVFLGIKDCFKLQCPIDGKPLLKAVALPCGHLYNQPAIKRFYKELHYCPFDQIPFDLSQVVVDMKIRDTVKNKYQKHLKIVKTFNDNLASKASKFHFDDRRNLINRIAKVIKCPLSQSLIKKPVLAQCGHTFDASSIQEDSVCPIDNLKITKCIENRVARDVLEKLKDAKGTSNIDYKDTKGIFVFMNPHTTNLIRIDKIGIKLGIVTPAKVSYPYQIKKPNTQTDKDIPSTREMPLVQLEQSRNNKGKIPILHAFF